MDKQNILVFLEQQNGVIAEVGLELISKANQLASELEVDVDAICLGNSIENSLEDLGKYGCKRIFYIDDKRLAHFTSLPYSKGIVSIIKKYNPQIVLFGATTTGRDVAPRVASELKCGLTADCTELKIGEFKDKGEIYKNKLLQIRPAFGGNIVATIISPHSNPSMATVREGVMTLKEVKSPCKVEIVKENLNFTDNDFLSEVIEILEKQSTVDLKKAPIIVSAGMGAADKTGMTLIKQLADTIGGEVGSSRPLADSGLITRERQVGQTGVTVRPNLYIACGISGQIQHRAGMEKSKRIVAINKDPNAPIFGVAHYGIVGDLYEVIPKMIKAYKNKSEFKA